MFRLSIIAYKREVIAGRLIALTRHTTTNLVSVAKIFITKHEAIHIKHYDCPCIIVLIFRHNHRVYVTPYYIWSVHCIPWYLSRTQRDIGNKRRSSCKM
jgi:hypothetical protein